MKYIANEIKSAAQGEMIYIEADTIEEAMQKLNVDDSVPSHKVFSKFYGKLYKLYKAGEPYNYRVIHISGDN